MSGIPTYHNDFPIKVPRYLIPNVYFIRRIMVPIENQSEKGGFFQRSGLDRLTVVVSDPTGDSLKY